MSVKCLPLDKVIAFTVFHLQNCLACGVFNSCKNKHFFSYMYNNQHDAPFFFGLLSYHTSTCFGRISSPSSGGRMYIFRKWYLLYFCVDCQRAWLEWKWPANS